MHVGEAQLGGDVPTNAVKSLVAEFREPNLSMQIADKKNPASPGLLTII
jgi:hypothetical protein